MARLVAIRIIIDKLCINVAVKEIDIGSITKIVKIEGLVIKVFVVIIVHKADSQVIGFARVDDRLD